MSSVPANRIKYVARGANLAQLPKTPAARKAIVICLLRVFYSQCTRYNLFLSVHVQCNVHRFTTSAHINCCVLMPAKTEVNLDVHIDEHLSSLVLNTISKLERLQPEYTPPFEMPYNTRAQMRSASGSDKNTATFTSDVIHAPDTMCSYIPDFSQLVPYSELYGMTDELTYYKQSVNRKSSRVNPIIDTGSKSDHEKASNTTNILMTTQKKFEAVRSITRGTIDRIKAVEEFVSINMVQRISAVEEKVNNMPPRTSTTPSSDVLHKKLLEIENKLKNVPSSTSLLETVESRLHALESKLNSHTPHTPTFANAVAHGQAVPDNERLEKLEVQASENERKNRLLQITIVHPSIDNNTHNLHSPTVNFFRNVLKMENREIGANFHAQKTQTATKILVTLPHHRFKAFIFAVRHKIRESSDSYSAELFINENFTPYSFSLLMMLKNECVKRRNDQAPSYETVYTFEGIVYVKMKRDDPNDQAIAVRSHTTLRGLLTKLDAPNSSITTA